MRKLTSTAVGSVIALAASLSAAQADKLTLYCSAQEDWCQLMARSFEDATGIDVNMTRKSSGETFAQIRAESSNPKGDVWWGGTGDPHLQAAEEGFMIGRYPKQKARATRRSASIQAHSAMATMPILSLPITYPNPPAGKTC